jgi:hypothetical protein
VERQPLQGVGRALGPPAAGRGVDVDPLAVHRHQGELDRDEEPGGEDEQEYGQEAEGSVDRVRPNRA